jgi:hypothetical protein
VIGWRVDVCDGKAEVRGGRHKDRGETEFFSQNIGKHEEAAIPSSDDATTTPDRVQSDKVGDAGRKETPGLAEVESRELRLLNTNNSGVYRRQRVTRDRTLLFVAQAP